MTQRICEPGFIAALDQSGGSTPKALAMYGIEPDAWGNDETKMFELIHEMRTRIIVNPAVDHRISGAILFEKTMNGQEDGLPVAQYLWEKKNIVPFLKVDEGLADEANGVQLMKPMTGLGPRLEAAVGFGVFGTKMRSFIHSANADGIKTIVDQQFDAGLQILEQGLMPILEPELSIKAVDKVAAEVLLKENILTHLQSLEDGVQVMLKLTLPETPNFYQELVDHPSVLRFVALSGGYSRAEANAKLADNHGIIASFSRALIQDLRSTQSEEEYTQALDEAIESIYQSSIT